MDALAIRQAQENDVDALVAMRCELAFEDVAPGKVAVPESFDAECRRFLLGAIGSDAWQIWVAEADGDLVANAYVALLDKVPRPVRERTRIAYLTNVYTRPAFRGRGIGARLVGRAQQAAAEADAELMIVWPSEDSVAFYERVGFDAGNAPLVWNVP